MTARTIPAPLLGVLLACGSAYAKDLPVTETPIGRLAGLILPDSLVVSPDAARLAYATKAGDVTPQDRGLFLDRPQNAASAPAPEIRMVIDNKFQPTFSSLSPVVFSPDSQHAAYAGQTPNGWVILIDGKQVDAGGDDGPAIAFSPDNAHTAWVFRKEYQWHITVDAKEWPIIQGTGAGLPRFSPDSAHLAAVAKVKSGSWTLFLDGQPTPMPAGAGKAGLDRLADYAFRPDGHDIAYQAGLAGPPKHGWQLFTTSGWASAEFEALGKGPPVWSPDGKRLAFAATSHERNLPVWYVVTKEATSPPLEQLRPESVGFLTTNAAPQLLYLAQVNKQWRLFLENKPVDTVAPFDGITTGSFTFSPDHRHYAFAGARAGKTIIVRDARETLTLDEPGAQTFGFSPDSAHLAFAGRTGAGPAPWHVYVDTTPGPAYAGIGPTPVVFSPDSRTPAYAAMLPTKQWKLVAGDSESKPYDSMLKGGHVAWKDASHLTTIALQKTIANRLEAHLGG